MAISSKGRIGGSAGLNNSLGRYAVARASAGTGGDAVDPSERAENLPDRDADAVASVAAGAGPAPDAGQPLSSMFSDLPFVSVVLQQMEQDEENQKKRNGKENINVYASNLEQMSSDGEKGGKGNFTLES